MTHTPSMNVFVYFIGRPKRSRIELRKLRSSSTVDESEVSLILPAHDTSPPSSIGQCQDPTPVSSQVALLPCGYPDKAISLRDVWVHQNDATEPGASISENGRAHWPPNSCLRDRGRSDMPRQGPDGLKKASGPATDNPRHIRERAARIALNWANELPENIPGSERASRLGSNDLPTSLPRR